MALPPTLETPPGRTSGPFPNPGVGPLVRAPSPPAKAPPPTFGDGVGALFSGLRFIVGTPGVWGYALVPVVVLAVVALVVGVGGYEALSPHVLKLFGRWAHGKYEVLRGVAHVLTAVVTLVVGLLLGTALAQPLSGPALERIVRRAEAKLGVPPWPETTMISEIVRSIEGLLVTLSLGAPLLAFLFLLGFLFPPLALITTPIQIVVTALLCAWDLCDYPLSIRGVGVRERVALLRRHLGAVLGFGLGLSLLSLVPCALFLALPIGVAGAAHLIARIEASERPGRHWEAGVRSAEA